MLSSPDLLFQAVMESPLHCADLPKPKRMGEGCGVIASGSSAILSSEVSDTFALPYPLCMALLFIMLTPVLNTVS